MLVKLNVQAYNMPGKHVSALSYTPYNCSTYATASLLGGNNLPANTWVRADELPGELNPGSRSRGSSICRENHTTGSLSALLRAFSRQITCHCINVVV